MISLVNTRSIQNPSLLSQDAPAPCLISKVPLGVRRAMCSHSTRAPASTESSLSAVGVVVPYPVPWVPCCHAVLDPYHCPLLISDSFWFSCILALVSCILYPCTFRPWGTKDPLLGHATSSSILWLTCSLLPSELGAQSQMGLESPKSIWMFLPPLTSTEYAVSLGVGQRFFHTPHSAPANFLCLLPV